MSSIPFNFNFLFNPSQRLPSIKAWLVDTVWTKSRYEAMPHEEYLATGETAVCSLEEAISTGASKLWDELEAASRSAPSVKTWLSLDTPLPREEPRAAVIFDGLSLRELPLLLTQAETTGFRVKSAQVIATCLPSETRSFVNQRVLGKDIGPSQLRGRAELAERNIEAFYLDQPTSRESYPSGRSLLIWSSYPDRLFNNDEARFEALFSTFHEHHIPTFWKNSVQAVPMGVPIVVTSDHGYIFFGAGMESNRGSDAAALLGQSRWKQFELTEKFPTWHSDLQILPQEHVALLRGRLRARPQGGNSRKLYQHGGLSLMEILVPWIELERI